MFLPSHLRQSFLVTNLIIITKKRKMEYYSESPSSEEESETLVRVASAFPGRKASERPVVGAVLRDRYRTLQDVDQPVKSFRLDDLASFLPR